MANKFLGALGLDVPVNKIKEVIAKLNTKQDNLQIPVFTLGKKNEIDIENFAEPIFAIKGIKFDFDNLSVLPDVNSTAILVRHIISGGVTMKPLAINDNAYFEVNDIITLMQALISGDSWTGCNLYREPVNIQEITATEVTDKFNS